MKITSVNGCPYFSSIFSFHHHRVCEYCKYYIHKRLYNIHYCSIKSKYFKLITDKNYFKVK